MKLGIIGYGHISKRYFEAAKVSNSFDIVAVCDTNPVAFAGLTKIHSPIFRRTKFSLRQ